MHFLPLSISSTLLITSLEEKMKTVLKNFCYFIHPSHLAPMVRAGELPTRLMALAHGADLVWSPEIIDKKLIQCVRKENTALQTVDYVVPSKVQTRPETLVFRTYPKLESSKLIFQIGSASPALATQAALKVINDVSGIDINAGHGLCPLAHPRHTVSHLERTG
ncbi:Smm1p [Saccharomyces cerevisiae]|nr:Smm1p [Saccharomyces cerevisiae]